MSDLTEEKPEKILGGNGLGLYGIDPTNTC